MKLLSFLLFLAVFFQSCKSVYDKTPHQYKVTHNPKFRLKGKLNLSDSTMISTSYLYGCSCNKTDWFKFYKDGRVILGYLSKIPKEPVDLDSISGFAGYYKVEKDKLTIEMSYTQTRNGWYILMLEGTIKGDTITFNRDHARGAKRNIKHYTGNNCVYVKTKQRFYLLDPDW